MLRETGNAFNGLLRFGADEKVVAIWEWDEHLWVFDISLKAIAMQFQITDDLGS